MRKRLLILLAAMTLSLAYYTPVCAETPITSTGDPEPEDDETGGGGGGGGETGDGDGEYVDPGPYEPHEPNIISYTPVVTSLHSLNALFAADGQAVYFMPRLEDFPVDLTTTCANTTSEDGKTHGFAIVYDGDFNNEVTYVQAQNANSDTDATTRLQTSKKVYSQTDNSRCLNLLGYDLLLSNEETVITKRGSMIYGDYYPTLVGTAPITAKTAVMDLYKAVGVYEWDVKIVYGKDDTLAVDTHPIQQQLNVLTNDNVEGGIVTDEGATYIWATRTNPEIYWERCKRDAIFDGGAHKYTKANYIGNDVSVTFSKNEMQTVTFAEFCQLAKAFMELYGEPVVTEQEIELMIQAYSLDLPTTGLSEEAIEAIRYLAAKGILEPGDVDWNKNVTFADIEPLLLRIADKDSRLIKDINIGMLNLMNQQGFVEAPLVMSDETFESFEQIVNPFDSDYFDYYIEAADGVTNFYLQSVQGLDLEDQNNYVTDEQNSSMSSDSYGDVVSIPTTDMKQRDDKQFVFACDNLVVSGADDIATTSGSGYFNYLGIRQLDDKYYYHFQISRTLSQVTISYDYDPELEELYDITSYTLPDADGGVYNVENGQFIKQTFDEAQFTDMFVDRDRLDNDYNNLSETQAYLADMYWYRVTWDESTWSGFTDDTFLLKGVNNADGQATGLRVGALRQSSATNEGYDAVADSVVVKASNGHTYSVNAFKTESSANVTNGKVIVLFQTDMPTSVFTGCLQSSTNFNKNQDLGTCYYRHEDGTLLVSADYLKRKGLINSLNSLPDGEGIYMSTNTANITIRNDLNCVIVGDTYVVATNAGTLYYQDANNTIYVNLRACLGFASGYVPVVTQAGILPVYDTSFWSTYSHFKYSARTIHNFFPNSSVNVTWQTAETLTRSWYSSRDGFALTGTNPLGSYMVVYDLATQVDYLYVWHLQDVNVDGTVYHLSGDARSDFASRTGLDVSGVSSKYVLKQYQLSKNNDDGINPRGIKCVIHTATDDYTTTQSHLGYVFQPPEYDTLNDALRDYCDDGSRQCVIPIATVGGRYINLNMNACSDMEGNPMLPLGTLPGAVGTYNIPDGKMGTINETASYVEESSASYDSLDNVVLYAAPVGIFQYYKGLGRQGANDVTTRGIVFYGSSQCTVRSNQITVGKMRLEFEPTTDAIVTYLGSGYNSIYAICDESSHLGAMLEVIDDTIETVVTEPEALIDWGAYKFERLVKNMDDWSSIVLIFVLNILPRIGMLLFFVLILLSLIKNVRPWRMFCERVFDVYSFLTMGKQNVNTINTNRVIFISMICLAIFFIILDGNLFNFIIWVSRGFIYLTQR